MRIIGLSGSLRTASLNRALLAALAARAPEGVVVEMADFRGIPVYDGDLEDEHGIPPEVTALQALIAGADALLIASPEYNGGVPGGLKNALDWCSRGDGIARVFANRPTGLVGATPGRSATRHAQTAWLQTFRQFGVRMYSGALYVDNANRSLVDGAVTDPSLDTQCARYMDGFAKFIRA